MWPATMWPPMMSHDPAMSSPDASSGTGSVATDTAAADLRTKLNLALGEHIIFASKATGAALGGRTDEFAAYVRKENERWAAVVKAAGIKPE